MKATAKNFAIMTALTLTSAAYAVTQKVQIGVLDMQKVILSVEEGKIARDSLEKEIKGKESEFKKQKTELDKLNKEWADQAALLSEQARMRKQKEFQEKFMELRNAEMAFQAEIKKKEGHATRKIAVHVAKLVDTIAKDKKLDAVFETNSAGLLYVNQPVDLTSQVIDLYNKKSATDKSRQISKKK